MDSNNRFGRDDDRNRSTYRSGSQRGYSDYEDQDAGMGRGSRNTDMGQQFRDGAKYGQNNNDQRNEFTDEGRADYGRVMSPSHRPSYNGSFNESERPSHFGRSSQSFHSGGSSEYGSGYSSGSRSADRSEESPYFGNQSRSYRDPSLFGNQSNSNIFGNHQNNNMDRGYSSMSNTSRDSFSNYANRHESRHSTPHHEESMWESVKSFFGMGPKGYKRSDERIREDVSEALYRDPHVDASEIEVSVKDGVVTLRGSVTERRMKRLAEDCVEAVHGVDDVQNEIRVESRATSDISNSSTNASGSSARTGDKTKSRGTGDRLM